jgi:uncharacterized membrane protein YraQ (UPF0718 family)
VVRDLNRLGRRVDTSLLLMAAAAAALLIVALAKGGPSLALLGGMSGLQLLGRVAPQILLGFALAGLVLVLLPSDALGRMVGTDSGLRGLAIATVAGIATPGGPFVHFPLVAALMGAGAGPGPMSAYLTAWSLLGWNRVLIYELPLLGAQFTAARLGISLILPFVVGLSVPLALRMVTRLP